MHALIVGLGGIGQRHLRNLRRLLGEDVRISAVRIRRETTELTDQLTVVPDANVEGTYGVHVLPTLEAALAESPDIGIVSNPTSLHVETATALVGAGIDVLVEKPLGHELAGAKELIQLAEAKGVIGMVAYQLRFHPCVERMASALAEGLVGPIHGARIEVGEYLPSFHPYEDYRRMYASRRDQGGGVTLTQIHELDLMLHLLGAPEAAWSIGGRVGDLEIDVEDSSTTLFRYRRPDEHAFAVTLHQDYLARPPRRSFEIWGERGRLTMNLRAGTLDFLAPDGALTRLVDASAFERNELFVREMAHFLDCVRHRRTPVVSLAEGLASVEVALALRESHDTGELVRFSR